MPTAKMASLTALCIHYSVLTIVMHISRISGGADPDQPRYKASSAVVVTELGKLAVSSVLAAHAIAKDVISEREGLDTAAIMLLEAKLAANEREEPASMSHLEWDVASKPEAGDHHDKSTSLLTCSPRSTSHSRRRSVAQDPQGLDFGRARTSSTSVRVAITGDGDDDQAEGSDHTLHTGEDDEEEASAHDLLEQNDGEEQDPVIVEIWMRLKSAVFASDLWKLSVPAVMFVVQNNLQYVAASNLSVTLFQITYQLKILTTALCSVLLLNRTLSYHQWLALAILTMGVAVVQLNAQSKKDGSSAQLAYASTSNMNQVLGLTSVILACMSSGFASVYFERVLKAKPKDGHRAASPISPYRHDQAGLSSLNPPANTALHGEPRWKTGSDLTVPRRWIRPTAAVWIRNIQLSIFGLIMGMLIVMFEGNKERFMSWGQELSLWYWENIEPDDGFGPHQMASMREFNKDIELSPNDIWTNGLEGAPFLTGMIEDFFVGFTPLVWAVVLLQIIGGLLNALVVQHADNIAKGFATSLSILLSFAASVALFSFTVSPGSIIGGFLVITATWLYNRPQTRLPAFAFPLSSPTSKGNCHLHVDVGSGRMERSKRSDDAGLPTSPLISPRLQHP